MYSYALLDPRPIPAAQAANEEIFASSPVFGIEVTVTEIAARCSHNLDPQHAGQDAGLAAIEAALACNLPENGATLATVRPDPDALGAMAILAMRAESMELGPELLKRVALVAESDKFALGGWPGPRSLPSAERLSEESTASVDSHPILGPLQAAIGDFKIPIAERVRMMRAWLENGVEPAGYRERWLAEQAEIAAALADGRIKVRTVADGRIAVVESAHRSALSIGYRLAPMVVALNPAFRFAGGEPHRKFAVCQFTPNWLNLKAALSELSELESGWGGSPTIGGSPQGISSTLTVEQVAEVLKKHLNRIVRYDHPYFGDIKVTATHETRKLWSVEWNGEWIGQVEGVPSISQILSVFKEADENLEDAFE